MRLDTSFLLVLPLFAWLIASQIPDYLQLLRRAGFALEPGSLQSGATPYLLGLTAALGLFSSVLVHELGHAVVARLYGVEVREITLWFLGGVAQFDELPRQPGAEAVVGIAGPLTSFGIALASWATTQLVPLPAGPLFVLSYLTVTNAALGLFNLLPALPLDGGRILRSLLALGMPYLRATRISATISRVVALLMGVYGFITFQLLLVAVAFFVYNAVAAETRYAAMTNAFEDKLVRDVMTREVLTVEPDMRVGPFLKLAAYRKHLGYPVVDAEGRALGFARLSEARELPEDDTIASLVREAETVGPDEEAMEAVRRINASGLGRLLVVDDDGRLVGILSKTDLVRALGRRTPSPTGRD